MVNCQGEGSFVGMLSERVRLYRQRCDQTTVPNLTSVAKLVTSFDYLRDSINRRRSKDVQRRREVALLIFSNAAEHPTDE